MITAMRLRVALIDDHQPFRQRLRELLQTDREIEIVAEAGSGEEFLEIAPTTDIDVACMDISMPGISGIEATQRLLACKPGVRVIGLSAYADPLYVEAMLNAGAVGYFTKVDADETLLRAIHAATVERPCLGAGVSFPATSNPVAQTVSPEPPPDGDTASLGAKEREVLRLLVKGFTSLQVGQSLSLAPAMIDVYCRNIMRKLRVSSIAELSAHALRDGSDSR